MAPTLNGVIDSYHDSALGAAWSTLTSEWTEDYRQSIESALLQNPRFWAPETAHHRAEQSKMAIRGLLSARNATGQAILKELWFVAENGIYLFDGANGNEYNSLEEWVEGELATGEDDDIDSGEQIADDYLIRLARVVDRIFFDVQANTLFDEQGEQITVERLIYTPRLSKRLGRASYTYGMLTERVQKRDLTPQAALELKSDLLSTVLHAKSPATVAMKCDEIQAKETGQQVYAYQVVEAGQDAFDLTIRRVSSQDLRIIQKLLRGLLASA